MPCFFIDISRFLILPRKATGSLNSIKSISRQVLLKVTFSHHNHFFLDNSSILSSLLL